MPCLRQTSATVSPLARSRSASRSSRTICSAVRRLAMSPSWTYPIQLGLPFHLDQLSGGRPEDFGREVIPAVADRHDQEHAGLLTQHLSEDQIGDLYLWLARHYPPSQDPQHDGAHMVGPRESIAYFRNA